MAETFAAEQMVSIAGEAGQVISGPWPVGEGREAYLVRDANSGRCALILDAMLKPVLPRAERIAALLYEDIMDHRWERATPAFRESYMARAGRILALADASHGEA